VGKAQVGVSPQIQASETQDANALTTLATQQAGNSQTLFNESNPGFTSAENFYGSLASGDPTKIATAISPATQQIAQATAGAKANIMANSPAGGEKNLALEQADVSQGAEVGKAATGTFLNSFESLGKLAGQGTGDSISAAGTGISGFGASTSAFGQIGQQQVEQQQLQFQQKGQALGAFGSLGGDIASVIGSTSTAGGAAGLAAGLAALSV
jgi:hypothetical protein